MPLITIDNLQNFIVVIAVILFFLATAFISSAIKIVPENKRIVLFRAGRSQGTRGPGIVTVIPLIDMAVWIDLQSLYRFEYSNVLTADKQEMTCLVRLEGKIVDPEKSILNVPNLEQALYKEIEKELIDIAGTKSCEEVVQRRDWLADQLKDALYRSSRAWGYEVNRLKVDEIRSR